MSGFDWSTFDNSRKNNGDKLEKELDDLHRMLNQINPKSSEKYLSDLHKNWDEHLEEQTSRFKTHYSTVEILMISAFCVGILIVLIILIFSFICRKNRTQSGRVLSTGTVLGPGAVQQNQQIPMIPPGQGGAVPPNIGTPYSNRPLNEEPSSIYPTVPPTYLNESGKDSFKDQMKSDDVDRVMKEMELPLNPKTESENPPLRFDDALYAYRGSTEWPPFTEKWPLMDPMTPSTESPNRIIIADFKNKLDYALDKFDNKMSNQQERLNYYNYDFAKRMRAIDLKSKIKLVDVPVLKYEHRPSYVFVSMGCVVGIIFVLFLIIFGARKKKTQPGIVLSTGTVLGQGAVQQNQQIPMRPPGQGGAVSPNIGMPHSNSFNQTCNEEPPPYPGDTVPLVNNSVFVEMGIRNEGVAMATATDLKPDNSRTEESLNVGMQNNRAGQGTRTADDKESIKYVNEKSFHN